MAMDSLSIQVAGLNIHLECKINFQKFDESCQGNDDESLISKLKSNCWDLVESRTLSEFQNSNPLSAKC